MRGSGAIDEKEVAILKDIKAWMDVNGESIYGTRPWTTFGEGPLAEAANPMKAQGFNEGQNYTAKDVRFVQKGKKVVYATALGWPESKVIMMKSFRKGSPYYKGKVKSVELLGYGKVKFTCGEDGLKVMLPEEKTNDIAPVLKVKLV